MTSALETGRPPQQIRPDLWLFPPNRDCRGGSSWWLDVDPEPVLIYCPPLTEATFADEATTASGLRLLWTPGPTPGHAVVHAPAPLDVLFCGRLLVPVALDRLAPLQHRRTFHWPRQQRSLERLRRWLPAKAAPALASGAGLGALRGGRLAPFSSWAVPDLSKLDSF